MDANTGNGLKPPPQPEALAKAFAGLTNPQTKMPSSMQYNRIQDILENDAAFRLRLGPRKVCIETCFGEKAMFSEEAVAVTNVIHAEGLDAHKVPSHVVLNVAFRLFKVRKARPKSIIKP